MIRCVAVFFLVAVAGLLFPHIASASFAALNADGTDTDTSHRRLADISEYDSEKSMDVLTRLWQMKSQTRQLDETTHNCGVILYYHIPGTEGTAVNEWLKKLKDENDAGYISSTENKSFIETVEKQLESIQGWKVVYAQDNSFSLHYDPALLQKWRDAVTKQQCRFLVTTMFADIIDHSVSHTYKNFAKSNCSPSEFKERGYDMGSSIWTGQLDYFLFNNGKIADIESKEKVKRGIDILMKNFDLVLLNNRVKFVDTVVKVTGWSSPGHLDEKMHGDLIFTKDLVSKYNKLAGKNGDGDFIDAVNHIYNNDLGYLADLMVQ